MKSWRSLLAVLSGPLILCACTISSGSGGLGAGGSGREGPDREPAVERIPAVRTGLDVLAMERFGTVGGKVGLITNQSGVDRQLRSSADLLSHRGLLQVLFAPEHGLSGAQEAGEVVGDGGRSPFGVPVYSLYGKVKKPTPEMLRGVDLLIYDIQDVGSRTYTYLSTLRGALEVAAEMGIEIWVLDRPDPLGGRMLDGPVLGERYESFVGPHTVPLCYGMTPGELARMLNAERKIGARLRVVPLDGWRRGMTFEDTGLPWVAPSPNIPTADTCPIYCGFVLLEGTNLSEGRGTTRPFKLLGAPWLDARKLAEGLNRKGIPGARFRPTEFTPTFSKYEGELCRGVEVHVTDVRRFKAPEAVVAVLAAVRRLHPDKFRIRASSFDRLAGGDDLRLALERGDEVGLIVSGWKGPLEEFKKRRQAFLLYR